MLQRQLLCSTVPTRYAPAACCVQLVRYVAQVTAETQPGPNGEARPFYDFLESCLRHKTEMVIFEAARAICNLKVYKPAWLLTAQARAHQLVCAPREAQGGYWQPNT